jgi:hypothetical protein
MAVIHSLSPGFEDQVSGVRREECKSGNSKPYMKLRQNGIVSFPIRLAVFQARGGARVKLHQNGTVS